MASLLQHALNALGRGWAVFPCKPRSKEPLASLAPHGVNDATKDETVIRVWWAKEPNANPAIALGPSDLTVLDADEGLIDQNVAREWFKNLQLPATFTVRTGRRTSFGIQFYFAGLSDNHPYRHLGVQGEVRSAGYYVMAPGAIHDKSGEPYLVIGDHPPAPIPEIVKKLTKAILPRPQGSDKDKVEPTERHYFIVERARELYYAGLAGHGLKAAVRWLYDHRCAHDPAKDQRVADGELDEICDWVEDHKPEFPLEPRDFIALRFASKNDKKFQEAWDGNFRSFDGDREKAFDYVTMKLIEQRCKIEQQRRIIGSSPLAVVMQQEEAPTIEYSEQIKHDGVEEQKERSF